MVKDGFSIPKYATMEPEQTLLDGTFMNFPDDPSGIDFGYWSLAMSDRNGQFGTSESPVVPTIDITFSENHSSAGLTFRFAEVFGEWVSDLTITWYDKNDEVIGYGNFQPDDWEYFANRKVVNYRKIHIEINGTNKPYRYAKIANIDFGLTYRLEGSNVISAHLYEQIHAISATVHINMFRCKIQSDYSDFYTINPDGLFALLQERQRLVITEIVDGVKINMGTYFLDEMSSDTESVSNLKAIDLMGIIDKSLYEGGVYHNVLVSDLVADIMDSAKAEYTLDPSLASLRISGHIPTCSHREALQQIVFAIGAVATSARSDKVHIYPQSTSPARFVGPTEKYPRKPPTMKPLVTGVEVYSYAYEKGTERKELLSDYLSDGQHTVTFNAPVDPASLQLSTGSILTRNANFAVINVPGGDVTLTGNPYVVQTRLFTRELRDLPSSTTDTIETVESATMIAPGYGQEACNRVFDYTQKRYTTTFGMIATDIVPSDVIQVGFIGGGQMIGTVEIMDTDLAGGFRSNVTVNFASLIEHTKWDYTGEIWTGDEIGVI